MWENYPSLGALVADVADVLPDKIVTFVILERDGDELTRPWPQGR